MNRLLASETANTLPPDEAHPSFDAGALPTARTEKPGHRSASETIDLLEVDLASMIRDVQGASNAMRSGIKSSAETLTTIRTRSERLAALSREAKEVSVQLAAGTQEFANSAAEISRQVREANTLSQEAASAAEKAGQSVTTLQTSSSEIGKVLNLISEVAKQTNLLALNATIEAARAGDAGRGFAVVANEVKALSVQTQNATKEISRKIDHLQDHAAESIMAVERITASIEAIAPLFAAATTAVEQQTATANELSRSASHSSQFAANVVEGAQEIEVASADATNRAEIIDRSGKAASDLAEKLKARFVIFLRQTEIGDRRQHDRLPCELAVTLHEGGADFKGRTIDLSEGGMLVQSDEAAKIAVATTPRATIEGIGTVKVKVVNRSAFGLHLQFIALDESARSALATRLSAIREENREFVDHAIDAAQRISQTLEGLVLQGKLERDALFDNEYVPIEGTNPQQYRTRFLDALEAVLPAIQEPLLAADKRMLFGAAVDRNGYLPVHNRIYSKPQKPDDVAWNTANCRNRRIFDDRAGLCAARNVRPVLIQSYPRDMGNGIVVMMREVDAPIRVFGRHWGGFRAAYKL